MRKTSSRDAETPSGKPVRGTSRPCDGLSARPCPRLRLDFCGEFSGGGRSRSSPTVREDTPSSRGGNSVEMRRSGTTSVAVGIALLFLVGAFGSGCAFMNRDNTPLLNFVEGKMWPDQTGWRIVAAPVVFPAGFVAVTIDAVVVHPATVVDDAWDDTVDALWDNMKWDREYLTVCASLPWRALCTPLILTGDFLGRAMFDIKERADEKRQSQWAVEREEEKAKRRREDQETVTRAFNHQLDQAENLLRDGKPQRAYELLWNLDRVGLADPAAEARFCLLSLKAGRAANRVQTLVPLFGYWNLSDRIVTAEKPYGPDIESTLTSMREDNDPVVRWYTYQIERMFRSTEKAQMAVFEQALNDRDAVVRQRMLVWIEDHASDRGISDLAREAVERAAAGDPDPANRAFAKETLRLLTK